MDTEKTPSTHTLEVMEDPNGDETFVITSEAGKFTAQDLEDAYKYHNAMFTYSGLGPEDKATVDKCLGWA